MAHTLYSTARSTCGTDKDGHSFKGSRVSHPIRHSQPAYLFPNRITFSLCQGIGTFFFWAFFSFLRTLSAKKIQSFFLLVVFYASILTSQLQSCEENNTQSTLYSNTKQLRHPRSSQTLPVSSPQSRAAFQSRVPGSAFSLFCRLPLLWSVQRFAIFWGETLVNLSNRLAGILSPLFLSRFFGGSVR